MQISRFANITTESPLLFTTYAIFISFFYKFSSVLIIRVTRIPFSHEKFRLFSTEMQFCSKNHFLSALDIAKRDKKNCPSWTRGTRSRHFWLRRRAFDEYFILSPYPSRVLLAKEGECSRVATSVLSLTHIYKKSESPKHVFKNTVSSKAIVTYKILRHRLSA